MYLTTSLWNRCNTTMLYLFAQSHNWQCLHRTIPGCGRSIFVTKSIHNVTTYFTSTIRIYLLEANFSLMWSFHRILVLRVINIDRIWSNTFVDQKSFCLKSGTSKSEYICNNTFAYFWVIRFFAYILFSGVIAHDDSSMSVGVSHRRLINRSWSSRDGWNSPSLSLFLVSIVYS